MSAIVYTMFVDKGGLVGRIPRTEVAEDEDRGRPCNLAAQCPFERLTRRSRIPRMMDPVVDVHARIVLACPNAIRRAVTQICFSEGVQSGCARWFGLWLVNQRTRGIDPDQVISQGFDAGEILG